MKKIGKKLKIERKKLLKSQEEVEEEAGLSQKHLGDLEAGKITPLSTTYYYWCDALGVNGHTIFDEARKELEREGIIRTDPLADDRE